MYSSSSSSPVSSGTVPGGFVRGIGDGAAAGADWPRVDSGACPSWMIGKYGRAGGIRVPVVNRDPDGALDNRRPLVPPYNLFMSSRRHKLQMQPSRESPPWAQLPYEAHRRRSPKVPDTLAMSNRRKARN